MCNTRRRNLLILTLLVLAVLPGCGGGGGGSRSASSVTPTDPAITTVEEAKQHGAWTILVYMDADNDLESDALANISQMETIGSTKNVRVIAQIDRIKGYASGLGDWTDTRRYLMIRDSNAAVMSSIRLDTTALGELDMADWHTLKDFVEWGVKEFPADHYCLVIWDHGNGWIVKANELGPSYKYVLADDTSSTGMNVMDIPQALAGVKIDVIAFDACLMEQLEVAYELVGSAQYMVGSAASEPAAGYDYSLILSKLGATTTAESLSRTIVQCYAQSYPAPKKAITHCALNLSKTADLVTAVSNYASALSASGADLSVPRETALNYSTADSSSSPNRHYLDLMDYAGRCWAVLGDGAKDPYNALATAVSNAVVLEAHSEDLAGTCGIGIYVPAPTGYDTNYARLRFAAESTWDEWLRAQVK